jgi:hypothetical protein
LEGDTKDDGRLSGFPWASVFDPAADLSALGADRDDLEFSRPAESWTKLLQRIADSFGPVVVGRPPEEGEPALHFGGRSPGVSRPPARE